MIDKLLKCFSAAAWEVMRFMLDAAPAEGTHSNELPEEGVSVRVGLVGDSPGQAVFHFPRVTALKVVEIMGGIEVSEIDDFVTSAVGELSNIISGNAATALADNAVAYDIQPPEITIGSTLPVDAPGTVAKILSTTAGNVGLSVSLA